MKEYVLMSLKKGVWYYATTILFDHPRLWDIDMYVAYKFKTHKEANDALIRGFSDYHWGGYFKIEEIYVFR
jgi:hypothetical protein